MRQVLVIVMVVHGLLHFIGVAKAFGLAELPQLTQSISRTQGLVWLLAGLSLLGSALLLASSSRLWWALGGAAVLMSQAVIIASWTDAKWGTVANVVVLMGVVYGFASQGPFSFRAQYDRAVSARAAERAQPPVVTEADLEPLPEPVRRYLRSVGAVGQPRVHHFTARWQGRIRAGPDDPWMSFTAEQYNVVDEPSRFFLMDARRGALPVDVLHVFENGRASMHVRLLSLVRIVHAEGPQMTRAETVTLFNDLCLLAPAALIDAAIEWEPIDRSSVRGRYTAGPNTVSAVLSFNQEGELVDFVSDDRLAASTDGGELTPQRWSTPVREYRRFGSRRASGRGEGWWHPVDGEPYAYIHVELLDLEVNNRPGLDPDHPR